MMTDSNRLRELAEIVAKNYKKGNIPIWKACNNAVKGTEITGGTLYGYLAGLGINWLNADDGVREFPGDDRIEGEIASQEEKPV